MTPNIPIAFAGRFKVEKRRPGGKLVSAAGWQNNLILDNGLEMFGTLTSGSILSYCQVGSGTATPSVNDTTLTGYLATSTDLDQTEGYTTTPGDRYLWVRRVYEFSAGTATGNISEFGISPNTSGNLFSRALIKDEQGNPTTVSIQADEILVVTYELRMYKPEVDAVGSSNGYSYTARAAYVDTPSEWAMPTGELVFPEQNFSSYAYSGGIGSITSIPGGDDSEEAARTNIFTDDYVPGSHQRSGGVVFEISEANFDIRSFKFDFGTMSFQVEIDPPISKTSDQELTVRHTVSWGRV
ncbi:hypothetical protein ACJJI3_12455 [Microbulbifer sp. ZKSA004]|uniref:hypothetical protein n=1 Tax=Microbulbifer sp. ZKSA004 TaxID=3243389 RepID=UPI004039EF05